MMQTVNPSKNVRKQPYSPLKSGGGIIHGIMGQATNKKMQIANQNENLEKEIRNRIRQQSCSLLRSAKEIVRGIKPIPLRNLSASQINQEIVNRVGYETAKGTVNMRSHFVPCGTYQGISMNFGHGTCYRFQINGRIYGASKEEIERYVKERNKLPSYTVPLFKGGNHEVLAYTGTLITSVVRVSGKDEDPVMNSLD